MLGLSFPLTLDTTLRPCVVLRLIGPARKISFGGTTSSLLAPAHGERQKAEGSSETLPESGRLTRELCVRAGSRIAPRLCSWNAAALPNKVLLFAAKRDPDCGALFFTNYSMEPLRDSGRAIVSLHCWQGHTSRKYFQE